MTILFIISQLGLWLGGFLMGIGFAHGISRKEYKAALIAWRVPNGRKGLLETMRVRWDRDGSFQGWEEIEDPPRLLHMLG